MIKATNDMVIFEDQGFIAAKVVDPAILKTLREMPEVSVQDYQGYSMIGMPWTDDACRILNNAGLDATKASPLLFANDLPLVEGKYNAMTHQLYTAAFIVTHPRAHILSDPRTGKTGATGLAMDYLQRNRYVAGAFLIITTVTTMQAVWENSIKAMCPNAIVKIVHGKNRETALEQPADFYITNYDSCRLSEAVFLKAVQEGRIGACVIDEMTHIGNSSSKRHKSIFSITRGLERVIGITGSPAENAETVYGMARMINPSALPCRNKSSWINLVTYQWGTQPYQRSLSKDAPAIIHRTLQPAVRFNKNDILDLPPVTYQDRQCDMSKAQKELREKLRLYAMAILESGETVTGVNGGALFQRMMQMAVGFATSVDGKSVSIEHKERLETIIEAIEETTAKTVIFGNYKFSNHMLADELRAAGHTVEIIDGDVTGEKRADILRRFSDDKDPRVLIAHPVTTSFGVELATADTMIFNGPVFGGFTYAQALERLSSVKQKAKNINIINVYCTPEEQRAFKSLRQGRQTGALVAEMFENFSLDRKAHAA